MRSVYNRYFFTLFALILTLIGNRIFAQPLSPVTPQVNATLASTPTLFQWNGKDNAINYKFELASDSLFSAIIYQNTTPTLQTTNPISLTPNSYYWRIVAQYPATPNDTSQINKFIFFIPPAIPNLKLWVSADTGVTITSGAVSQWDDLSGNNFHLTQSIIANSPLLSNNAIGDKPTIRFNGNQWLKVNFGETFPQPNSIFIIWKTTSNSGNEVALCNYSAPYCNIQHQSSVLRIYGGSFLYYDKTSPFDFLITTAVFNQTNSKLYENSILKSSGDIGNYSRNGVTLGAAFDNNYWLNGEIAEVLYYSNLVTDNERLKIETYLHNKYASPVNLGYDIKIHYGFCDTTLFAGTRFSNYLWSTGETTEHIKVNKNGRYWVRATDIFGFQTSDTLDVNYLSLPQKISDFVICQMDTTKISLSIGSPFIYNWSNGQSTANFSTTSPGTYQLQITDSLGCMYRDTFTVILDSLPSKLSLGNDTAICFSNLIGYHLIDYSPVDGLSGNFHYLWNTGDTTATTNVNSTGDYSLRLTNQRGCVSRDTVNITMQGIPPAVSYLMSKDSACTGDTIHFADTTFGVVTSRNWDLGNGTFLSDSTFDYTYSNGGTYTISLTSTGNNGCPKTVYKTLLIYASPQVLFTTVPACTGLPTYFTNSSIAAIGDSIINNLWNFDDLGSGTDNISTLQNPEHLFSNPGSLSPQLSITTQKGCYTSATQTLNVVSTFTFPQPFTLVFPQNNTILSDSTVTFKWNYSENGYYYTLQIASDISFTDILFQKDGLTGQNYTYKFLNFGTYYWRVIAVNICGNLTPSPICKVDLFIPSMYSGLQLWLSGDSLTKDASNNVSKWSDLSANNYNISQSTVSYQPKQFQNQLNGHALLRFDGSNDYLDGGDILDIGTNNQSLFLMGKSNTNAISFIAKSSNSDVQSRYGLTMNNSIFRYGYSDDGDRDITTTEFPLSKYQIISAINNRNNNINKLFINGIIKGSKTINGSFDMNSSFNLLIGAFNNEFGTTPPLGGFYLNGDIGDIIIYNAPLSEIQQLALETFIHNKYAPPVNLGYDIKIPYKLCDTLISAQANHFTNYLWSTGDTTPSIHVFHTGSYWVRATDFFGYETSDTIAIYFLAQRTIPDNAICVGNSYQYNWTPLNNYTLNWSNGQSGSTFTETQPGNYIATLTDTLGCIYRDTFNLYVDSLSLRMSLGNDLSLCSGNLLQGILDNYTVSGPQYLWNTGDTTPTITLTSTGDYWLELTDNHGCVARDTVSVYIHGVVPFVSFTAPGKCLGETTPFSDLSHPQDPYSVINQWHWDFGDGNNASTQNTTHNYANPGIYPITLTVTTDSNCSNSLTLPTVVYTLPEVYFTPILGCSNTPIQFTDRTQYTDNYTINQWQWDFGDLQSGSNNHSTLQHPEHPFDTAGVYSIQLRATSVVGCSNSLTQIVTIRSAPTAYFSASNTCEGETTWFNDSTATELWNPVTYREWQFDDGNTSNLAVTSKKYDAPGSYPVTYIINTLNGCTDTVQKMVNVYSIPVANFSANAFCLNEPIELESSSTVENDLIAGTQWSTGNQLLGVTSPITLHIDSAGSYPVRLFVISAHQCKDSITKTMVVKPIPQAQFTYNYDEHTIGVQIQFANTTTGGFTYEWYNQSTLFSTQAQPQYDFGAEGNYPILMIATNSEGCSDSASATILVSSPVMDIAITDLAITPIGDYRQATAYLMNMSNRNITDLWLNLNLNQQAAREHWTGMLQPGNIVPYTFQTQMRIPTNETLMYGCATVESPLFSQETNLDNNRSCVSLTEDFTIISVYPNPAHKEANILISIPFSSTITLKILSSSGELVKEITYSDYQRGISAIPIPLDNISSGLYILELSFNGKTERRKLAVE